MTIADQLFDYERLDMVAFLKTIGKWDNNK